MLLSLESEQYINVIPVASVIPAQDSESEDEYSSFKYDTEEDEYNPFKSEPIDLNDLNNGINIKFKDLKIETDPSGALILYDCSNNKLNYTLTILDNRCFATIVPPINEDDDYTIGHAKSTILYGILLSADSNPISVPKKISIDECSYIIKYRLFQIYRNEDGEIENYFQPTSENETIFWKSLYNERPFYEYGAVNHYYYRDAIALPIIKGEPLSKIKFTIPKLKQIITSTIEQIKFIHKKEIIHGDIKPDNIILTPTDEIKIIDLGDSVNIGKSLITLQGTPSFLAPEAIKNPNIATKEHFKIDYYSLGKTILRLCDQLPQSASSEELIELENIRNIGNKLSQHQPNERIDIDEALIQLNIIAIKIEPFGNPYHFFKTPSPKKRPYNLMALDENGETSFLPKKKKIKRQADIILESCKRQLFKNEEPAAFLQVPAI